MSELEQWVLNGLALNSDTTLTLEAVSDTPAAKIPEWVKGADSDGAILARPPKHDNLVTELRVRVKQQANMDDALEHIGEVVDKLQECEQNVNGLPLVWTPADGTNSLTGRALLGEITDLPKDWQDSGWFVRSPVMTIRLTRLPFWQGAEYLVSTTTSAAPIITVECANVPGDVDALGRLVVTDAASQSRRFIQWGREHRWYPTSSPPSLIVDSAGMVTTGYSGATGTRTGAYSGGSNNVITTTVLTQQQAVCGLGNLTHIGTFRPQLRFYASATTIALRLSYQALDGPFRSLTYKVPVVAGWNHVDLGLITIPQAALGSQRWTGRIEAFSTGTGGETLDIDAVWLIPVDAYAITHAAHSYAPGRVSALDDLGGSAGTPLNGTTAPVGGGVWATSGSTGDFLAGDATYTARATTGSRLAVLGTTTYTDVEVGVEFWQASYPTAHEAATVLVEARRGASDNDRAYLAVSNTVTTNNRRFLELQIGGVVGGLAMASVSTWPPTARLLAGTWYRLRFIIYASGVAYGALLSADGATLAEVQLTSGAFATGGGLASGKVAFRETLTGTNERRYRNFYAGTPTPEPIVCYSGRSIEFRHDTTLRQDSTGTYAGPPPQTPVGSRFTVPCAGGPGRKSRVAVIARRNDVTVEADDNISDSTTVAVYATPRYLAVPR